MDSVKDILINSAQTAVATYGVEGATTRKIAEIAGVADTNIYRFFQGRDELIYETYVRSSGRLINMVIRNIDKLRGNKQGMHLEECARIIFMKIWRFLLDDPNVSKFHAYYYHSLAFEKYAMDFHNGQVTALVEHLNWLFRTDDEAKRCINNVFVMIYEAAKRVADGRMNNTVDTADSVFADLFSMLVQMSNRSPAAKPAETAEPEAQTDCAPQATESGQTGGEKPQTEKPEDSLGERESAADMSGQRIIIQMSDAEKSIIRAFERAQKTAVVFAPRIYADCTGIVEKCASMRNQTEEERSDMEEDLQLKFDKFWDAFETRLREL